MHCIDAVTVQFGSKIINNDQDDIEFVLIRIGKTRGEKLGNNCRCEKESFDVGDVLVTVPDRFKYRDLVWDFCPSPK